MPGFVLHLGATVLCFHAGQAQPTVSDQRVRVSGQPVVAQPTIHIIAGCTLPPASGGPCVTAQWVTAATRIRASGLPVLLQDSQAICAPTGTGVTVVSTQARARAT